MNQLESFRFYGDEIVVVLKDGKLWVSLRRLCELLGVDFYSQLKKLKGCSWAVKVIITLTARDGKNYQTWVIDLGTMASWLQGINAKRVWVSLRRLCELLEVGHSSQLQKLKEQSWACVTMIVIHDKTGRKQEAVMIDLGTTWCCSTTWWVSLRRLCELLGVAMESQLAKLKGCSWAVVAQMATTARDGKTYETTMIDLGTMAVWLAGLHESKISNPQVRAKAGVLWVSLRRLCELLGLAMHRQLKKLKNQPWATVNIMFTVGWDGKTREMQMIDLGILARRPFAPGLTPPNR